MYAIGDCAPGFLSGLMIRVARPTKSLFLKSRVASRHGSPSGVETDMEGTMPWTEAAQANYRRPHSHRQNDLSDEEWALIAPLIPEQGRMGRPRSTDLRRVNEDAQEASGVGAQVSGSRVRSPGIDSAVAVSVIVLEDRATQLPGLLQRSFPSTAQAGSAPREGSQTPRACGERGAAARGASRVPPSASSASVSSSVSAP